MTSIGSAPGTAAGRRRLAIRLWTVAIAAASLSLVVVAPGVQAQDDAGEAFCGLFTTKEIKQAFDSKVDAIPDYGSCDWWASGDRGTVTSLNVSWNDVAQEDWDYLFPSLETLTVGGSPAWYWADEYEAALLLDVGPGVLLLDAGLAERGDARDGLVQLGELAVERAGSLPEAPELPGPSEPGTEAPADTGATDAVAAAFCAVLGADEVAAAVGGDVADGTPTVATEGGCEWVGGDFDDFIYVSATWDEQTLAEVQTMEGESVSVGGRPGWFTSELGPGLLYVELDQGLLALTAETAERIDPKAALTSLAKMVVSRSESLVPAPAPTPTPVRSEGLEGLFPDSVGGQPLSVSSQVGEEAVAIFPFGAALVDAVSTQGGDPSRLALALAFSGDFESSIAAFGLDGVDGASVLPAVLQAYEGSQTATDLAGKGVTEVRVKGSETVYVYAKDDVIWMVQAKKAAAEEILAALP